MSDYAIQKFEEQNSKQNKVQNKENKPKNFGFSLMLQPKNFTEFLNKVTERCKQARDKAREEGRSGHPDRP